MRHLRKAAVLGFALLTMLTPGGAYAHQHQGHVVIGVAAISPGPSGWGMVSIEMVVTPSGTTGSIVVDQEPFEIACARVLDDGGVLDTPTYHSARVEWLMEGVRYELRVSSYSDAYAWFHISTLVGDATPCVDGSAGGLALGRGLVAIIG